MAAAGTVSMGKVLGIAIVVSALVGGVVGYVAGGLPGGHAGPAGPATPLQPPQPPQVREFWMFTVVLPFNDSTPGFPPHDYFAPDRITVYRNDTVKIHFFNTEDAPEDHTFTLDAPYSIDVVVHYQQTANITFVASTPGIFFYRCVYHQPSMTGSLVVLQA